MHCVLSLKTTMYDYLFVLVYTVHTLHRDQLLNESLVDFGASSSALDEDMTGQIGTALYTAPEINTGRTSVYTQKVISST